MIWIVLVLCFICPTSHVAPKAVLIWKVIALLQMSSDGYQSWMIERSITKQDTLALRQSDGLSNALDIHRDNVIVIITVIILLLKLSLVNIHLQTNLLVSTLTYCTWNGCRYANLLCSESFSHISDYSCE